MHTHKHEEDLVVLPYWQMPAQKHACVHTHTHTQMDASTDPGLRHVTCWTDTTGMRASC